MIVQLKDINDSMSINNALSFPDAHASRFFHDRRAYIRADVFQPHIGGESNGRRQVFVLYFQLSDLTLSIGTEIMRMRIHNGNILNYSHGIDRMHEDEIAVDVRSNFGKPLFVCFDAIPIYGNWILSFGNNIDRGTEWRHCPAQFMFFAFIKTSSPESDNGCMELPRFTAAPETSYTPLGEDLRGSVGQPYGRTIRQLKTMHVWFSRVPKTTIDNYYRAVSIHKPHFIVPYPEDVTNCPPMWVTLAEPPEYTKRNESGWHWNCALSWREAY